MDLSLNKHDLYIISIVYLVNNIMYILICTKINLHIC